MPNKINLITGEAYTISELFSDERRIIIPDLQRDYCWGDSAHTEEKKELVSGFIESIKGLFDSSRTDPNKKFEQWNLGLLYGYEVPANHIQLCDGQQRITTIFLLLGMLNKYSQNNNFRRYLISDFEYQKDDREPYLNYSIRESSLYFLSDLVCNFFIHEDGNNCYTNKLENIKEASWYYQDYDNDPSIQSILKALGKIDEKINKDPNEVIDFGHFILNQLTFMYYDMDGRTNGEKTFVIINTTGEPLSAAQNLKPLVVKNKDEAEKWEDVETWFWLKRKEPNDTADKGYIEFLRWLAIYKKREHILSPQEEEFRSFIQQNQYSFPVDEINFGHIYDYWKALKWIYDDWEKKNLLTENFLDLISPKGNVNQKCLFEILALLNFAKKHYHELTRKDSLVTRNFLRLHKFLENVCKSEGVSKAINDFMKDSIDIPDFLGDSGDIVNLIKPPKISSMVLTDTEIKKLQILEVSDNREKIEEEFWKAQENEVWYGNIEPLIEWSTKDNSFDIDQFIKYYTTFDKTFEKFSDNKIRRLLLAMKAPHYPKSMDIEKNLSFGSGIDQWNKIVFANADTFKSILDNLLAGKTIKNMLDEYDGSSTYDEFIKRPELLDFCKQQNIQPTSKTFFLISKKIISSDHAEIKTYCKFLDFQKEHDNNIYKTWSFVFDFTERTNFRFKKQIDKSTLFVETYNTQNENNDFGIDIFVSDDQDGTKLINLTKNIPNEHFNQFHFINKRYVRSPIDEKCVMEEILKLLDSFL